MLLNANDNAQQGFDPEDILRRYLEWWRDDGFDTGQVAERVFDLVLAGMPNAAAGPKYTVSGVGGHTAGCNESLLFAGPANYCPVLVGAIGAVRY